MKDLEERERLRGRERERRGEGLKWNVIRCKIFTGRKRLRV